MHQIFMIGNMYQLFHFDIPGKCESKGSKFTRQSVKISVKNFYGIVISCKKYNNVCTLVTNCLCTHSCVISVFISAITAQLVKWTLSRKRVNELFMPHSCVILVFISVITAQLGKWTPSHERVNSSPPKYIHYCTCVPFGETGIRTLASQKSTLQRTWTPAHKLTELSRIKLKTWTG